MSITSASAGAVQSEYLILLGRDYVTHIIIKLEQLPPKQDGSRHGSIDCDFVERMDSELYNEKQTALKAFIEKMDGRSH